MSSTQSFNLFVIDAGLYGHRGFALTTLDNENPADPLADWYVSFDDWFAHDSFRIKVSDVSAAGIHLPYEFVQAEALNRASVALADYLMTLSGIQGQYFRDEVETHDCGLSELCQLWLRSLPSARYLQKVYSLSRNEPLLAQLKPVLDLEPIRVSEV